MRLKYEGGHDGPYAHNLTKVLEALEGHFIRGDGDSQKPDVEIELLPGAVEAADAFLEANSDSRGRLGQVAHLIDGFETPYGMELLSSAHWVAIHWDRPVRSEDEAVAAIYEWNERKRRMFREEHSRMAWRRLTEMSWISDFGGGNS